MKIYMYIIPKMTKKKIDVLYFKYGKDKNTCIYRVGKVDGLFSHIDFNIEFL